MKLTNEEKRIRIAEAVGWTSVCVDKNPCAPPRGSQPNSGECVALPGYFNDLNACHEAEKWAYKNQPPGWSMAYTEALREQSFKSRDAIEYNWTWHATAPQRFEALGQTLALWEAGQ